MVSPSRCPPWQPERPGPTRREPRRAQRSYTTRRDTIHVLKPGACPDAPPGSLQIGEVGARHLAGDDPGIVVLTGKGGQHGAGLGTKRHDPPASLGVGQLDAVALHVLPAQKLDLRQPAALRSSKRMAATADGISPSASRRTSPRRSVSSGDRNRSRFRSL